MEKKNLLGLCEGLNIDIIWKAWKDDIIRTTIDVQDKLAKYDTAVNKAGVVAVTQFVTGYESLQPLPTAKPRTERAERYGLFMKNDLITRCKQLEVNVGWKSSRDNLIQAILNAEDKAGANPALVGRIRSTVPPTTRSDDQPMARHKVYYKEKSRKYIKRRCKYFRINKSKRKPASQLARDIMDFEGKTSGMLKAKHIYIPKGPEAPRQPTLGPLPTTRETNPATMTPRRSINPHPQPRQHVNHEAVEVIYPSPAPTLVGGSGLPIATRQLDPVYERYQNQTQMPIEISYEPLYRTPRMQAAAAKYNSMSLAHLQGIVRARAHTRGIEKECETKLECIDILLDDDRKNNLLPVAPAPIYPLQPGQRVEVNPDSEMFVHMPTVMQVEVLRILEESPQEVESFKLSREAFYELFSQAEMEKEVLLRRLMYAPTVRRQLVRNDMRMFERVRRRRAGLPPRVNGVPRAQGVASAVATTVTATAVPNTDTSAAATTVTATTIPNQLRAKSVTFEPGEDGSG